MLKSSCLTNLARKEAVKQFVNTDWILLSKGDRERGIIELEKGSRFALNSALNILHLIDEYAKEKMYDKIVPLYERLIEIELNNSSYYASLAVTYMAMGKVEKSVEVLNKAVELDPALKK